MVGGGRRGVRGSLQGTVVSVVEIKLVTDVTEETGRRQLVHAFFLTHAVVYQEEEGGGREMREEGDFRSPLLTRCPLTLLPTPQVA